MEENLKEILTNIEKLRLDLIHYNPSIVDKLGKISDDELKLILSYLPKIKKKLFDGIYSENKSVKNIAAELRYSSSYLYQLKVRTLKSIAGRIEDGGWIGKRLNRLIFHISMRDEISEKEKEVLSLLESASNICREYLF